MGSDQSDGSVSLLSKSEKLPPATPLTSGTTAAKQSVINPDDIKEQVVKRAEANQIIAEMRDILRESRITKSTTDGIPRTFEEHFSHLISDLNLRISILDRTRTELLGKGIAWGALGVGFCGLSIMIWHSMIQIHGYKSEVIYGIVASTALFAFIEFLSAWFFRQYKHCGDTTMYLVKVKAMFDRYGLLYLANKGNLAQSSLAAQTLETLNGALTREIKWPNDDHLTRGDISFPKEALEQFQDLLKGIQANRKDQGGSGK